ncbi:Rv1733c family protein [Streptomyces sp. SAS_270]|uniref:Rv1733c family protein n=1 Tax=Streptomyces sp. SAS_270 TaxID=3412748 RepID=UPI00403CF35B
MWRWRRNPLRRRDDVVEGWVVLGVWTAIAVGAPFVGTVCAHSTEDAFARQRADRHPVQAVLMDNTSSPVRAGWEGTRVRATVRWTADGTTRTDRTMLDAGHRVGSEVKVWVNGQGRLVTRPPSATESSVQADALGLLAATAFAAPVYAGGRVLRRQLDRRRIDEWGRAWDRVGPQWGREKR